MSVLARRWNHLRTSRIVLTGVWADAVLVMAASAWNGGEAFEALGQHRGEGIALGVAVDVGLATALIGDRALHLHGKESHWGRALRVITALMSLGLNCGVSIWQGHYGVAVFHAFLPILLVLLSEYAQDTTLKFGEIADEREAEEKAARDAQLRADREAWEARQQPTRPAFPVVSPIGDSPAVSPVGDIPAAPIGPTTPPAFQAVPVRPDSVPAVRPADRSGPVAQTVPQDDPDRLPDRPAGRPAGRSGAPDQTVPETPAGSNRAASPDRSAAPRSGRSGSTSRTRKRAGKKPRTDEQLTDELKALTARNGGDPPSRYQVKQVLGVGSDRAERLLAELVATTTPAAAPSSNGAGRKEGTA